MWRVSKSCSTASPWVPTDWCCTTGDACTVMAGRESESLESCAKAVVPSKERVPAASVRAARRLATLVDLVATVDVFIDDAPTQDTSGCLRDITCAAEA